MASNVTRDHHRWTRDITSPQDTEIDVTGDLTLDVSGDITLDAGGADINFAAGGTSLLNWNALGNLKMMSLGDADDYFNIQITTAGKTVLTTVDDSGTNEADIVFQPQGDITMTPGTSNYFRVSPTTKTSSSTFDATIDATETTSTTASTQPVISTSALTDDASIDCDVDQIDSGGVSAGLKMYLIGYKTL